MSERNVLRKLIQSTQHIRPGSDDGKSMEFYASYININLTCFIRIEKPKWLDHFDDSKTFTKV